MRHRAILSELRYRHEKDLAINDSELKAWMARQQNRSQQFVGDQRRKHLLARATREIPELALNELKQSRWPCWSVELCHAREESRSDTQAVVSLKHGKRKYMLFVYSR